MSAEPTIEEMPSRQPGQQRHKPRRMSPVTGQCASSKAYLSEEYLAVVRKTLLVLLFRRRGGETSSGALLLQWPRSKML